MKRNRFKTSATIGLYVTEKRDNGYYHVNVVPVFVGLRPNDMADIDAGHPLPGRVAGDRITNIGGYDADRLPNGLFLADLQITSQGNDDDAERHLYGFEVSYSQQHSVCLNEAGLMFKTLTTIEKRTEALKSKYGRPATFGAYLLRVAAAIGATRIVLKSKHSPREGSYRDMEHNIEDLPTGANIVDHKIDTWAREREKAVC